MSLQVLTWDAEHPAGFVLTNAIRSVFEDHFALFTRQDQTFLCCALEQRLLLIAFIDNFFPLELVALVGWVNSHKSLSVLYVCAKTLKLYDFILRIDLGHVFFFTFTIGCWWQLEVDYRSLSDAVCLYDQRLLIGVQV